MGFHNSSRNSKAVNTEQGSCLRNFNKFITRYQKSDKTQLKNELLILIPQNVIDVWVVEIDSVKSDFLCAGRKLPAYSVWTEKDLLLVWGSIDLVFVCVVEIGSGMFFVSGYRNRPGFRVFYIALERGVQPHIKTYARPFKELVDILDTWYTVFLYDCIISPPPDVFFSLLLLSFFLVLTLTSFPLKKIENHIFS